MRQVKCVSPHGGARHGTNGRGDPVQAGYTGPRQLPPSDGGYIDNACLGRVAVGDTVSAPDPPAFIADGFHFERVPGGGADECTAAGPDCWCGQHKAAAAESPPAPPAAAGKPAPQTPAPVPAGEGK